VHRISLDDLTAIVVNWGTPDLTIRSVRALVGDGLPAGRVVVVDNGSDDDSFERFQHELSDSVNLRIEQNAGYARAAKAGAGALPGAAYLFVNNDAFVHRAGSVEALLRCLDDASIGIVVSRVLNEDLTLQPSVHPIQTPAVALVLATGLNRLLPNRWQPAWGRHWDHSESREIRAAAGPAMLVRGEVWDALGGYAVGDVLYAEDIDICWRAIDRGWRVWYTNDAEFVHQGGRSTGRQRGDVRRAELIARAEAAMTRRNLRRLPSLLALAFVGSGLALRWLFCGVMRQREASALAHAALRGHLAGVVARRRG
jgi:N-acetylglucosaminyl-diphospho-decaprenol L-rhamnosyltransferase